MRGQWYKEGDKYILLDDDFNEVKTISERKTAKSKCMNADEKFWKRLDKLLLGCPNISEDAREEVLECFPKNKRSVTKPTKYRNLNTLEEVSNVPPGKEDDYEPIDEDDY